MLKRKQKNSLNYDATKIKQIDKYIQTKKIQNEPLFRFHKLKDVSNK